MWIERLWRLDLQAQGHRSVCDLYCVHIVMTYLKEELVLWAGSFLPLLIKHTHTHSQSDKIYLSYSNILLKIELQFTENASCYLKPNIMTVNEDWCSKVTYEFISILKVIWSHSEAALYHEFIAMSYVTIFNMWTNLLIHIFLTNQLILLTRQFLVQSDSVLSNSRSESSGQYTEVADFKSMTT